MKKRMRNKKNSGFTLVEVLATAGILVILLAIAMVGVVRYIDVLKITELDNAARDIYMAAENRAVLLHSARRLDDLVPHEMKVPVSAAEPLALDGEEVEKETLHYVSRDELYGSASTYKDLLPDGNIDPTLYDGDFYIVYDLTSGSVREVFYAEDSEAFEALVGKYGNFEAFYNDEWSGSTRDQRLSWKNEKDAKKYDKKTLVGRYSGEAAQGSNEFLDTDIQEKPYIDVVIVNKEELTVTVTVKWDSSIGTAVREAIKYDDIEKGPKLSVKLGDIELTSSAYANRIRTEGADGTIVAEPYLSGTENIYKCTWVLDSLAQDASGNYLYQFKDLFKKADGTYEFPTGVTPGVNFTVKARIEPVDKNDVKYSFIEATAEATNNSLFEYWENSNGTEAHVAYLRHLQNLSADTTNTNGYDSGVGGSKTSAVQTAHIWGDGNGGVATGGNHKPYVVYAEDGTTSIVSYKDYKFVPIVNDALESYNGNDIYNDIQYEIRNLNLFAGLKDETTSAPVGLFSTVSKTVTTPAGELNTKSEMTLSNIRLVNTTMMGTGGTVGALAGQANDATITGCWVYWDETYLYDTERSSDVPHLEPLLGSDKPGNSYNYQLIGATVGGLVGQASGTTTINNSLAATMVKGEGTNSVAGGLVGQTAAGASVSISTSYADCYLTGSGNVAGLVGNVATSVTLQNCYAAGFIDVGNDHTNNAGLCLGTGTTRAISGVYSVMVRPGTGGTSAPSVPTAPNLAGVHFLGDGTDMTNSDFLGAAAGIFKEKGGNTASGNTYTRPYYLEQYLRNRLTTEPTWDKSYDYPGLVVLPHYGDWGKEPPVKPFGLAYYEDYGEDFGTDRYGVFSAPGNINYNMKTTDDPEPAGAVNGDKTMKIKTIKKDGYAVVFTDADITNESGAVAETVNIVYFDSHEKYTKTNELPSSGFDAYKVDSELTTWQVVDGETKKEVHYLFVLPDGRVVDAPQSTNGKFYRYLGFKLWDQNGNYLGGGEYFYNPHFPETVQAYKKDGDKDPAEINIRSPRHLYHLSQYDAYYHHMDGGTEKGYTFNQVFNLSYYDYTGYGLLVNGDGSLKDVQIAIGNNDYAFNGTYNGDPSNIGTNHTISGLHIVHDTNSGWDYQGLFGYSTGVIKNVTVVNGEIQGKVYIGGIVGINEGGSVIHCEYSGTVTSGAGSTDGSVGGIAGENKGQGTVQDCFVVGENSSVNGLYDVGGIVGINREKSTVIDCHNWAPVNGGNSIYNNTSHVRVGGIVGYNESNTVVSGCTNNGDVTVAGGICVGGIVGSNGNDGKKGSPAGGMVLDCANYGTVQNTKNHDRVGGIVGHCNGSTAIVESCENHGEVMSKGNRVGGIVGYNKGGKVGDGITPERDASCINYSNIKGDKYIGGIVGYNEGGTISNCNNGEKEKKDNLWVIAEGQYAGGIVGNSEGSNSVLNCVNYAMVTSFYNPGGEADVWLGGIAGRASVSTVTNCENYGTITYGVLSKNDKGDPDKDGLDKDKVFSGDGETIAAGLDENILILGPAARDGDGIGGIVGKMEGGKVEGCNNHGDIKTNGDCYAIGGIVGELKKNGGNEAEISQCSNKGDIMRFDYSRHTCGKDTHLHDDPRMNAGLDFAWDNSTGGMSARVGGIVGFNNGGKVMGTSGQPCKNYGNIVSYGLDIGGVAGFMGSESEMKYCDNYGEITSTLQARQGHGACVGGIVGMIDSGTVSNCVNQQGGTVTVYGSSGGGVVGGLVTAKIQDCHNEARVVALKGFDGAMNYYIGGVVGLTGYGNRNDGKVSTLKNCYNTGAVTAPEQEQSGHIGGVVGEMKGVAVEGCYNTGSVTGHSAVGGVAGHGEHLVIEVKDPNNVTTTIDLKEKQTTLKNSYSIGTVTGSNSVGGVVGQVNGMATQNCYNTGFVKGTQNVGGIVGEMKDFGSNFRVNDGLIMVEKTSEISGCYHFSDCVASSRGIGSSAVDAGATGISRDKFAMRETFVGWDFESVWEIKNGAERPTLVGVGDDDGKEFNHFVLYSVWDEDGGWIVDLSSWNIQPNRAEVSKILEVLSKNGSRAASLQKEAFGVTVDGSKLVIALADGVAVEGIKSAKLSITLTVTPPMGSGEEDTLSEEDTPPTEEYTLTVVLEFPAKVQEPDTDTDTGTTDQAIADPEDDLTAAAPPSDTEIPSPEDPDPVESEPKDPVQPDMEVPEPVEKPEDKKKDPVPEPEQTAALPPKSKDPDDPDADDSDPGPDPGSGPNPDADPIPEFDPESGPAKAPET